MSTVRKNRLLHAENRTASRATAGESGFTLLELLISMTLFLIVTAAIYGLLSVAGHDRHTTNQRVEIMQNLRVAANAIGRDALNAGYRFRREGATVPGDSLFSMLKLYSAPGTPYTTTANDTLTPIVSGRNTGANTLTGAIVGGSTATDQITFAYFDESFNAGNNSRPVSLSAVSNNGNSVTIASGTTSSVCNKYDILLFRSATAAALGVMTNNPDTTQTISLAATDPLKINLPLNDTAATSTTSVIRNNVIRNVMLNGDGTLRATTITRLIIVTYKVLPDGTLVREVYGENNATSTETQALAYNVEDMEISYVLEDGTETTDPVAGPDGVTTWRSASNSPASDDTPGELSQVRQVRVTFRAKSAENDRRNNQPFKITLTSTFNTRNLGYANNPV